jgi:hypothetical protein
MYVHGVMQLPTVNVRDFRRFTGRAARRDTSPIVDGPGLGKRHFSIPNAHSRPTGAFQAECLVYPGSIFFDYGFSVKTTSIVVETEIGLLFSSVGA